MRAFALLLLLLAAPAAAEELRDYCPDRPGIGTPPCVIDRGHLSVEIGLGDETHARDAATTSDSFVGGDLLLRYGLTDHLEARLGWTAFGHVRERDRSNGERQRATRTGDVSLGFRANLANPDGSGLSVALMPTATLPTGRQPIGAGDWTAALLLPLSYQLNDALMLDFTGELDAAADEDGRGRHLAYGAVGGVAAQLTGKLTATLEYQLLLDRDPSGHATQHLAGLSFGWLVRDDLQLDVGGNAGLDRDTPDTEVYVGLSRRF